MDWKDILGIKMAALSQMKKAVSLGSQVYGLGAAQGAV